MILSINTSDITTELSLLENDLSKISVKRYNLNGELSESLLLEVEKILEESNYSKVCLSGVMVNKGPGSYTGLRIGVTVANFLAFSLNIPVIEQANSPESLIGKFVSPVLPYYKQPPHITKPVLPS